MITEYLRKTKGLSYRETEVAKIVSTGVSNKEAAAKLFITEKTVKFHLTSIYKKLNVKNRSQLIVDLSRVFQPTSEIKKEKSVDPEFPSNVPSLPGGSGVDS